MMCDEGLKLAKAKGAGTIDVQRTMRNAQRRVIAANDKQPDRGKHATLHAPDGVHLSDLGQVAMGFAILKGLGTPAEVSWAAVDAESGAAGRCDGCEIRDVKATADGLAFTRRDEHLPLNLAPLWTLHGFYIPLGDELNRHGLTVTHLAPGRYEVEAGGRRLGTWTAAQLANGVNIASATADPWEPGGPWHAQGHIVKALTDIRDTLDFTQRDIASYLQAHPQNEALRSKAPVVEASLIELQRATARPVEVKFVVRKAAAAP
jgi:hypothetical protein